MRRYIIKKILLAIPVLLGITIIDYLIMSLAGNPLDMMSGPRITEAAIAVKAAKLGLDQPVWTQYFNWLGEVLHGNLGYSYKSFQPVSQLIGSHIGPTLLLMGTSLAVGLLIAIPTGIYSAVHRYQRRDFAVVTASFFGSSIPGFFLALVLIYLFTVRLGWLPSSGMETPGIGHFRVINKHALRNALLPIVTVIGMQIPTLFGGAVIVEQIFSWPGLGLIAMNAITGRDYPVIMGICLLSAVVVLAANLLTDIVYALVDPTIKY